MAITLHDVARLAGVSIKTVSNVINDYPHIRPATREKVEAAIDELGYQPNLSARSLRSGRSGVISLLIPDLRNAYFAELADAVMRAARAKGLSVIIEQMPGGKKEELEILRGPRMQLVDGILYSVLALGEEDAHHLDNSMPMVLLGDRIFHGPKDHVTMQNTEGSRAATEHLLSLGRRRVAALGAHPGEVVGSAGLRLDGYRQALAERGVEYDPALVIPVMSWHRQDGAEAMRAFLAEGVAFDGLVGFNDSMALGAMRVMQEAGLQIPGDVAVIGFDDIDETRYSIPSLSTIDPSKDQIAETAVDLLLERIENPDSDAPARDLATEFRVVQRESSAN
ncbi:LacI family DNA-binding transcriptional regulator [Agreia sp. VKM Ac-1783]|uniref:LacI family DNA-binding transcriptional regulator n=1 Tax=Agreia sp. VKM Ac-1783 TaxID=1938889 RepID=UPI000A2AB392|nr:LacI family DNA-binding transcriptional regulator [Agreia sp. VKM Ac-1783]SMQ59329.1 transcriptional regulator, LacI family [Agreia sp. VKM Ac-1783]